MKEYEARLARLQAYCVDSGEIEAYAYFQEGPGYAQNPLIREDLKRRELLEVAHMAKFITDSIRLYLNISKPMWTLCWICGLLTKYLTPLTRFFRILKSDTSSTGRFLDFPSGVISVSHFIKRPTYPNYAIDLIED